MDKLLDSSFGVNANDDYYMDLTEDDPDIDLARVLPVDEFEER